MKLSNETKELFIALKNFQSEITNTQKTAVNPFLKNKYTPLHDVIDHIKPVLNKYGLSFLQFPCSDEKGVGVVTILIHETGQYIESEPYILPLQKQTAQEGGSAITYARRYALCSCLGITSIDEDDDGNEASGTKAEPKAEPKKAEPKEVRYIFTECGKEILSHDKYTVNDIVKSSLKAYNKELCYACYIKATKAKKETEKLEQTELKAGN